MKTFQPNRLCVALVSGAALLGAVIQTQAQTIITSYTNTFDTAAKVASWHHWYDINAPTYNGPLMDWDSTMNNTAGVPTSGSVMYSNTWPGHNPGVNNQGQDVFYGTFAEGGIFDNSQTIDLAKYDSIAFDIHSDASSPTNAEGNICTLQVGGFRADYNFYVVTNLAIPTSTTNGWTHYVCVINKATVPTNLFAGVGFNINCYGGPNVPLIQGTGTTKFWLDNIQVNRSKEKLPPPTFSREITEPGAGLTLLSSSLSSDQYQRTNLKLVDGSQAGWLGQPGDVTYSFTILRFPSPVTYPGYQAHIFLTTGAGNSPYLDYNDPNLIFLDVKQNANGTGNGTFRYKTNQPNGNAMVYSFGTLGSAASSNVLGTWSLTFNRDTNIIVKSPDGTTFNTNITADAAALFASSLNVVFGAQPNNPTNVGQAVVLSAASVTNAGTGSSIVNDNFLADTTLDTGTWMSLAVAPNTVALFPQDPGQRLVKWTLPDTGFGLQVSSNLMNPNSWATLTGNEATGAPLTTFSSFGYRNTLVPSTALRPTQSFFRLFTRTFTKLQVLLPGETAAPGTPTGKTGTPDAQPVGFPFPVTVNAVNANWYLAATADDLIHLTSTDGSATLPADRSLSGGTVTFNVTLNATGTFTITASDVTDGTKTANTSASVTAN